mmetsp:Transcript_21411/g.32644  ORF Transcript_21411/g.32644 Transcript_21411/m.32644 type:complete len:256 (+) Transcript_21411:3330-4097(+)
MRRSFDCILTSEVVVVVVAHWFRLANGRTKYYPIHTGPLEPHHILRQGPRLVAEDVLHLTQIADDGTPRHGGGIRLLVVHAEVVVDVPHEAKRHHFQGHVQTQRYVIIQQCNEQQPHLNEIITSLGPIHSFKLLSIIIRLCTNASTWQIRPSDIIPLSRTVIHGVFIQNANVPQIIQGIIGALQRQGSQGGRLKGHDDQNAVNNLVGQQVQTTEFRGRGETVLHQFGIGPSVRRHAQNPLRIPQYGTSKQQILTA